MEYEDIIDLPHHQSTRHKPMAQAMRAAQFAPFAALTGYDDAIDETARLTDSQLLSTDDRRQHLDLMLRQIMQSADGMPRATIVYFVRDRRKAGGSYCSTTATIKQVDEINHTLQLTDGTVISLSDIIEITEAME